MEKKELNENELLQLLNECLYAYVRAENKQEEKQQVRNIKALKKALKKGFKKKIKFDKESMVFVFKN